MLDRCRRRPAAMSGVVALLALAGSAAAQPSVFFSEIMANPPGPDNGFETIEFQGTPGLRLTNHFLIVIEGDFGAPNPGTIEQVIDLSAITLGTNGLALLRDAAAPLDPPPAAGTLTFVRDFVPDLENGSTTFILGRGTLSTQIVVGNDLDVDDDGTLDRGPAVFGLTFTFLDAVSYEDGDTNGTEYADDVGGTALGDQGTYTPDVIYRVLKADRLTPNSWAGGDVVGGTPGPLFWDFVSVPPEVFGWTEVGIVAEDKGPDFGSLNLPVGTPPPPPPPPACTANCNGDTGPTGRPLLDVQDFTCFQNAFALGDLTKADVGGTTACAPDGRLDISDFSCFQNLFALGCP